MAPTWPVNRLNMLSGYRDSPPVRAVLGMRMLTSAGLARAQDPTGKKPELKVRHTTQHATQTASRSWNWNFVAKHFTRRHHWSSSAGAAPCRCRNEPRIRNWTAPNSACRSHRAAMTAGIYTAEHPEVVHVACERPSSRSN